MCEPGVVANRLVSNARRALKEGLERAGLEVRLVSSRLRPWEENAEFRAAFDAVKDTITMPPERCWRLWELCHHVRALPGDVAECGSYRGATARFISRLLPDRDLHLFDTFAGHPDVDPARDGSWKVGDFGDTSAERVAAYVDNPRATLHPGRVPETLAAVAGRRFCLVHLDMDLYQPTKAALAFFHPRMVAGGCILVDDYGIATGQSVELAMREFVKDVEEHPLYFLTGQGLLVRHPPRETRGA